MQLYIYPDVHNNMCALGSKERKVNWDLKCEHDWCADYYYTKKSMGNKNISTEN